MGNRVPTDVSQPAASAPSSAHQLISTSPSITATLNYTALITQQNYITTSCDKGEKLSRVGCLGFFSSLLPTKAIKTPIKTSLALSPQTHQLSCGPGARRGLVSRGLRDLQLVGKTRESCSLPKPPLHRLGAGLRASLPAAEAARLLI